MVSQAKSQRKLYTPVDIMQITARLKIKIRTFIYLVLVTVIAMIVYAFIIHVAKQYEVFPDAILRGTQRGLVLGILFWGFELFLLDGIWREWLRRIPVYQSLFIKTFTSTTVLAAALFLSRVIVGGRVDEFETWLTIGLPRDSGIALLAVFILHLILQIRRMVGASNLVSLLIGRYLRPVKESRIFLFLDIADSTALSQSLGDTGVHAMITRFFYDITEPVLEYQGETHRYIGDQVVVTWKLEKGLKNANCLRCYFAICDKVKVLKEKYQKDYGAVPGFHVGIHGGNVVIGECGDDKQEIVYFGDTVNTAARLEQACREFSQDMLISGELLEQISLPEQYIPKNLGKHRLRGRQNDTEVCTVVRVESEE